MIVLQITAASFSTDWEDYRDQEVHKGHFFMKWRSGVKCYREWCLCFHLKWDKMLFLFLCKKKFRNQVCRRSLQSLGSLNQPSSCLPRSQSPSSYNVLFPTPLHWLSWLSAPSMWSYFSSLGRQKTNLFKKMSNVTKTVLDQSKRFFKSGSVITKWPVINALCRTLQTKKTWRHFHAPVAGSPWMSPVGEDWLQM